MSWKQSLTPLTELRALDTRMREQLVANHITTVEELVGQIESSRGELGALLDVEPAAIDDLERAARDAIDPDIREAIDHQRNQTYNVTGALPPVDDD